MNDNKLTSGLHLLENNDSENIIIESDENVILLANLSQFNNKIELLENSNLLLFVILDKDGNNKIQINQNKNSSKLSVGILNLSKRNIISIDLKSIISGQECESRINILSLCNNGEVSIDSGIIIDNGSINGVGELNQENIFLGEKGKIKGIPGLDIRTNRAKANHSLKIEKINNEELFYLESRGIDKQNATHIMLASKINNLFSGIPLEYDYFFKEKLDNFLINN